MKNLRNRNYLVAAMLIASSALVSMAVHGATITEEYKNDSDMTNLFLWSDVPAAMNFVSFDLSDKDLDGWSASILNSGAHAVLEGPEVSKSKAKIGITFDLVAPATTFTFQFAEVNYDAAADSWTITEFGSIQYDGKKLINPTALAVSGSQLLDIGTQFAPSPVPIPNSALLFLSAIGFVGYRSGANRSR
ncbi:MAG: hypothetical protein ACU84Q_14150 [Gammaproteobacteria bacterium]